MIFYPGRYLHISIDDVINSFEWIYLNKPNSVFDEFMLGYLKKWHISYGLSFDLYVFEKKEGFEIERLQPVYWRELKENSDWLKLGWHQIEPGEIKSSIQEQMDSAKRVMGLINKECSWEGLSSVIRLHRYEGGGALLRCLKEFGVYTYLISDEIKEKCYDLSKEEMEFLYVNGEYFKEESSIHYRATDVRLDKLKSIDDVNSMMLDVSKKLNNRETKLHLEAFFHEWSFTEIYKQIQLFLDTIRILEKELRFNASVVVDNYIYFTARVFDYLFRISVSTLSVEIVTALPKTSGSRNFSNLLYYDGKIWMVPQYAEKMYVYDIVADRLSYIDLPYISTYKECNHYHVDAFVKRKYLWMLPINGEIISRIDMDNNTIRLYSKFPKAVTFDNPGAFMFRNMNEYHEKVYLFAVKCSHNLCMDLDGKQIEIWNDCFNGTPGIVINEHMVLLVPLNKGDDIRLFDLLAGTEKRVALPDYVWPDEEEFISFWHPYKVDNYCYILPCEGRVILKVNCVDFSLEIINAPIYDYHFSWRTEGFSGYDLLEVGNEIWITANVGSQILRLSRTGDVLGVIDVKIPFYRLRSRTDNQPEMCKESYYYTVEDFVEYMALEGIEELKLRLEKA